MPAKILYVTDLTYPARGRRYGDEDTFLSSRLREHFAVALCHPVHATELLDSFDAVVVRNCGPVLHFQAEYDEFRAAALAGGARVFNQLTGRADMVGKQYLVDLTAAGYPVIPTTDSDPWSLPAASGYLGKPKLGADSIGLRKLTRDDFAQLRLDGELVQPLIDFRYEVSFYFVGRTFQYALYTPDRGQRWELAPYEPSDGDLAFAQRFVDWNTIDHGIQRVDACRAPEGDLLLMELEDLNPFLSLERTDDATRDAFVRAMTTSLRGLLGVG